MTFRPEPMGWADIVIDRRSAPELFEAIAALGLFEPDRPGDNRFGHWDRISPVHTVSRELRAKIRPFLAYLPAPDMRATSAPEREGDFARLAAELDSRVESWLVAVRPGIERLTMLEEQRRDLRQLAEILDLLPSDMRLELWRTTSVAGRVFEPVICRGTAEDVAAFLAAAGGGALRGHFGEEGEAAALIGVVGANTLRELLARCRTYHLRRLEVPDWLSGTPSEGVAAIAQRLDALGDETSSVRTHIDEASRQHRMAGVRWLIERQNWLQDVLEQAHQGDRFLHLGGWVPRPAYEQLVERLRQSGKPFLIRLDDGSGHGVAPSVLKNPRWARRFELFVEGFGTPAGDEVDPSVILGVVTPLMFGYMFGDVGQGLLLMLAGWLLSPRFPWIRLMVPAGLVSIAFGFLYGSVFSIEHWLPALWLHPMEKPLVILGAPLVLGAALMLLSLGLGFAESRWRGSQRVWLREEVPVIVCYLAIPVSFVHVASAIAMVGLAAGVPLFAPSATRRSLARRLLAMPGAWLEILEHWFQLVVNTLSFTRLGAFALAHAGLSAALAALAELPGSRIGAVVVLVIGNLVITALEALVVSIQTTRLVMFEFFRRFYEGSGRRFTPLTLGGHPGTGPAGIGATVHLSRDEAKS